MTTEIKNSEDTIVKNYCKAMAYLLINCEHGYEISTIEQLKNIGTVTEVQGVTGTYDILIKIESLTVDILKEIINWKVRKIKGIHSTTTLICTESLSDSLHSRHETHHDR